MMSAIVDILAKLLMVALLIAWAVRHRRTERPREHVGFLPAAPAAQASQ
jgi:hypothetical protein